MKIDWGEITRVKDSISYLYCEHCHIEQDYFSIKSVSDTGETPINAASLKLLLLGPGTTITHRAIVSLSECGCATVWCGEHLRKFYSIGVPNTHSSKNICKQAIAYTDMDLHMQVVRKLYSLQLKREIPEDMNLNQLRGLEGQHMSSAYRTYSCMYGVQWRGRHYKTQQYDTMDNINKALICAYDLLYSICSAVISAMGYSTSISFIHSGDINSFSFDIADLFKEDVAIPCAFKVVSSLGDTDYGLEKSVRMSMRELIYSTKLMDKLPDTLNTLFDCVEGKSLDLGLWTPEGTIKGRMNYGNIYSD